MSERIEKALVIGLMLAIVFSALLHGVVEAWSAALFEGLAVTLFLLWGIKFFLEKKGNIQVPKVTLPIAALIGFAGLQSLAITNELGYRQSLSVNVEATRKALLMVTLVFGLGILAATFFADHQRLRLVSRFLIIYGALLAGFALIQYFTWNGAFYWLRPAAQEAQVAGPFVNHAHFAGYMEMLIPIPIGLLMTRALGLEFKLLCAFAAALMGIALILSLSRGGIIGFLAGMLFLAIAGGRLFQRFAQPVGYEDSSLRSHLWPWLPRVGMVLGLVLIIGLGVIWVGADPVIDRLGEEGIVNQNAAAKTVFTGRTGIWKDTLSMIEANPLFGVGLGAYETAYPRYSTQTHSLIVAQSHNDYLQILADCGIVGGLIALWFLAVLFQTMRQSFQTSDPLLSGLALGCSAGIVSLLIHSLFDFNLQLPSNALLFVMLLALIAQIGHLAKLPNDKQFSLPDTSRLSGWSEKGLVRL
jgi:O-antigen ligase